MTYHIILRSIWATSRCIICIERIIICCCWGCIASTTKQLDTIGWKQSWLTFLTTSLWGGKERFNAIILDLTRNSFLPLSRNIALLNWTYNGFLYKSCTYLYCFPQKSVNSELLAQEEIRVPREYCTYRHCDNHWRWRKISINVTEQRGKAILRTSSV